MRHLFPDHYVAQLAEGKPLGSMPKSQIPWWKEEEFLGFKQFDDQRNNCVRYFSKLTGKEGFQEKKTPNGVKFYIHDRTPEVAQALVARVAQQTRTGPPNLDPEYLEGIVKKPPKPRRGVAAVKKKNASFFAPLGLTTFSGGLISTCLGVVLTPIAPGA